MSTAILLFAAGFETTTNLLGNGLLALLTHPDQLADWRAHPDIAPSAVEELLRFDSPVQFNLRTALEPADLLGQPLARGDRIVVLQGAANRDPAASSDPTSSTCGGGQRTAQLRLGHPPLHRAPLARMEGRSRSTRCWPGPPHGARRRRAAWRPSFTLRGLLELPLRSELASPR